MGEHFFDRDMSLAAEADFCSREKVTEFFF